MQPIFHSRKSSLSEPNTTRYTQLSREVHNPLPMPRQSMPAQMLPHRTRRIKHARRAIHISNHTRRSAGNRGRADSPIPAQRNICSIRDIRSRRRRRVLTGHIPIHTECTSTTTDLRAVTRTGKIASKHFDSVCTERLATEAPIGAFEAEVGEVGAEAGTFVKGEGVAAGGVHPCAAEGSVVDGVVVAGFVLEAADVG